MFGFIVKSRLKSAFARLNEGDSSEVLAAMRDDCVHRFPGDHPLGGERRDMATIRAWYARLAKIFPDLRFDLDRIAVSGWPGAWFATVTWRDSFSLPNGERGSNEGVHLLRFSGTKVAELTILCDTERLARTCRTIAAHGVPEAALPPLETL